MYTTTDYVQAITGYEVTPEQVRIAQGLIETLTGKTEAVVFDANDRAILGNATAYQAVYIKTNAAVVFEQAAITAGSSGDAGTSFNTRMKAPFFSPLAVEACRKLSWLKSRSIHTAPMNRRARRASWWTE